jgi:NADPH-dependent curcumin reductase CurA
MHDVNRQWRLVSRPAGMPEPGNWQLVEGPVPDPGEGQVVARACWLSVDPYMRGRISAGPSYARPVEPGEVMQGGGVGIVVKSRHPAFAPGDVVESMGWGWQDLSLIHI